MVKIILYWSCPTSNSKTTVHTFYTRYYGTTGICNIELIKWKDRMFKYSHVSRDFDVVYFEEVESNCILNLE